MGLHSIHRPLVQSGSNAITSAERPAQVHRVGTSRIGDRSQRETRRLRRLDFYNISVDVRGRYLSHLAFFCGKLPSVALGAALQFWKFGVLLWLSAAPQFLFLPSVLLYGRMTRFSSFLSPQYAPVVGDGRLLNRFLSCSNFAIRDRSLATESAYPKSAFARKADLEFQMPYSRTWFSSSATEEYNSCRSVQR